MGNLYFMTTIVNRKDAPLYHELYQSNNQQVMFATLGLGTVANDILDYLGMESNEKAVLFSVLEHDTWLNTKKKLQRELQIDAPGGGIAFITPLSSVAGKKALSFLLNKEDYVIEEESTLKDTNHQLIIVISEQGYTNLIMDAARAAGAYGGTVIHAKGTGMEIAEKFMGVSLAAEREIIFIVSKTSQKNDIMQAIMKEAGPGSKAKAIVFSLPVTDTAGLRLMED